MAIAGAAMCVAASATFATATGLMTAKTVNEYKCGESGNNLTNKLGVLSSKFGDHDKIAQTLVTNEASESEPESTPEGTPTLADVGGTKPSGEGSTAASVPAGSGAQGTPTTT